MTGVIPTTTLEQQQQLQPLRSGGHSRASSSSRAGGGRGPSSSSSSRSRRPLRGAALAVVAAALLLLAGAVYMLGRPLYWRIYAEVIHRYEPDPALALMQQAAAAAGAGGAGGGGGAGGAAAQAAVKAAAAATAAATAAREAAVAAQAAAASTSSGGGGGGGAGAGAGPAAAAAGAAPAAAAAAAAGGGGAAAPPPSSAPAAVTTTTSSDGKTTEVAVDLSKLSLPALERLREKAREKQWEDEWWRAYTAKEREKREAEERAKAERERAVLAEYTVVPTNESIARIASPDGVLFVTWANHHYTDFAMSWVQHLQARNVTNFLVGAMDEDILQTLARRQVHTFAMQSGLTKGDFGWGSPQFAKMGREKVRLVKRFLALGVKSVVISDVDVMWLRDPAPFFGRFPEADVLVSSDHLAPTVGAAEELEKYPEAGSAFNIGIMVFRPGAAAFVDEWLAKCEADEAVWDQNAFNDLARRGHQVVPPDSPAAQQHYFKGDNGRLTVGVLPIAYFASGHVFFTQRLHETLGVEPYAAHATFQFSGTAGKRHRFREAGLWFDKYEYFRPRGGFLAYEPAIPQELLDKAGPQTGLADVANTRGHFALVNHQLKELRNAMALATILNRTLVLPRLWCGLDRYWAPHAGTLPGSSFKLPFVCPADHVLDLEGALAASLNPDEYGPDIDFREAGFLQNPQLPPAVLHSAVTVHVCAVGQGYCPKGDAPSTVEGDKVFLEGNLDSDAILLTLSPVSHVQILRFTTMQRAFGRFSNATVGTRFINRMGVTGSVWCCVDAHPGHIHYDLLWDVPHVDRFGRKYEAGWEPLPGP